MIYHETGLVKRTAQMPRISTHADVEVGITTGVNSYFTVPQSVVEMYELQAYARPMVGRSVQVNSLRFTADDWRTNLNNGARANLNDYPQSYHQKNRHPHAGMPIFICTFAGVFIK